MVTAPGISALVILVVAVVAFGGAAAPTLLGHARSDTVRAALQDVAPVARDLSGSVRGIAKPGPGTADINDELGDLATSWGAPLSQLAGLRASLPMPLRSVLGAPHAVVNVDATPALMADRSPKPANQIFLTFDPGFSSAVTFVDGEAPGASPTGILPLALSRECADALAWPVGEQRQLRYARDVTITVELSGIFDPVDAADGIWSHQSTGLRPEAVSDPEGNITYSASAYAPAGRIKDVLVLADTASTTVWFPLRADRVHGDDAAAIAAQMRGIVGKEYAFSVTVKELFPTGLRLRTSAPIAIDGGVSRASAMTAVVWLVAVGPLAVAVVVLALAGRMLAARRVGGVRLARGRGASPRMLITLLAIEAVALGIIGAIVGVAATTWVVGWSDSSAVVPLLAAVTPVAVIPVSTMLAARRSGRADLGLQTPGGLRRQIVGEAAVLMIAAAVVWSTAARGSSTAGVSPVLALLPLALAAAGCVVALRLVPLLLSAVEAGAQRRHGIVGLIGPARARRDPAVRAAPVLATVVGIAIALFSVAFSETVRTGIEHAAEARVGAQARVDAPYIRADELERIAAVPGVRAAAALDADERVEGRSKGRSIPLLVYVVDSAALADVQKGLSYALPLPASLRDATGDKARVVASGDLVASLSGGPLEIDGTSVDIVAQASSLSPFGSARSWVIVDRAVADRLVRTQEAPGTVLLAVDAGDDAGKVADRARLVIGETATATTPAGIAQRLDGDPALIAVRVALGASLAIVAVLLGFAVGMTLVLGAASRGRLMALLVALGYPRRRELPLVIWEVAPALLVALPLGVAAGLALPFLVVPALDVTIFVGGDGQPPVDLGGWLPVAVVAGFVLLGAVAVAIAGVAASRITAATTLRSLDEEEG